MQVTCNIINPALRQRLIMQRGGEDTLFRSSSLNGGLSVVFGRMRPSPSSRATWLRISGFGPVVLQSALSHRTGTVVDTLSCYSFITVNLDKKRFPNTPAGTRTRNLQIPIA